MRPGCRRRNPGLPATLPASSPRLRACCRRPTLHRHSATESKDDPWQAIIEGQARAEGQASNEALGFPQSPALFPRPSRTFAPQLRQPVPLSPFVPHLAFRRCMCIFGCSAGTSRYRQAVGLTRESWGCYTRERSLLRIFRVWAATALQHGFACRVYPNETSLDFPSPKGWENCLSWTHSWYSNTARRKTRFKGFALLAPLREREREPIPAAC